MENKINLAAILKDCPRGMELDCSIHTRPVIFNCVKMESDYPIRISSKDGFSHSLTYWGSLYNCKDAKCVIFPKGETTWEGFQGPFKDGDVVATNSGTWIGITTGGEKGEWMPTYCVIQSDYTFEAYLGTKKKWCFDRLATKKEIEKLFQVIKDNGYKWNPETKTLEKLIKLKFKVGDVIVNNYRKHLNGDSRSWKIYQITSDKYIFTDGSFMYIQDQDHWALNIAKFDISTLIPFESRVLARYCKDSKWIPTFWGSYDKEDPENPYNCCGMLFAQCIPYEGNEYLLNTADDCDEYFKTWQ